MNRSGIHTSIRLLLGLMVMILAFAEGFSSEELHPQQDAYVRSVQKEPNNEQGQGIGESVSEVKERSVRFLTWVASGNGHVPEGAVVGGRTSNGETLYIGRVYHKDDLVPGKIHPSHKRLYISYRGKEHGFYNYEVLVEVPHQKLPAK